MLRSALSISVRLPRGVNQAAQPVGDVPITRLFGQQRCLGLH